MFIWIAVILCLVIILIILCLSRVNIPRDPAKEAPGTDLASTEAYDEVSRWLLFRFFRFMEIRQLKSRGVRGALMDAGCGPGYIDFALAKNFPDLKITGIDSSRSAILVAQKKLTRLDLDGRLSFREDDIQNLSIKDNSLDFVISSLSLHHWTDPGKALKEIYRVLKPQGQLLIFDLRRDEPRLVYYTGQVIERLFSPDAIRRNNGGIGSIWSSYTPSEMRGLLSGSLFRRWGVNKGWGWAYLWGQK
jgi:ubiquinone/menaquinone biosynthesis C-methylase UbiE